MEKLVKKILVSTKLTVVTGLHIGGSKDSVEIGGIDNPVIKVATRKNQPYIPGSSLKGKIRCLLEQVNGATAVGKSEIVNNLFGYASNNQPSKLIVRDAYLTADSVEKLVAASLDMPYTENKYENTIDRVKGKAEHPRQSERVPAGAEFDVRMVINVWDNDNADELKQLLQQGIALIENDYLGGSGSRGYGQVKFGELNFVELSADNNWKA
ncbi:MAG: type III-A CRISPR-associated RAMP protein Csm3 [Paludibacteraceae bacterium]|nr:type III-A CRISPR-associated RAMP protein Csm3 [Paludibacteraceae bacterium]